MPTSISLRLSHDGQYLLLCSQVEIPRLKNLDMRIDSKDSGVGAGPGPSPGPDAGVGNTDEVEQERVESRAKEYYSEFTGVACC